MSPVSAAQAADVRAPVRRALQISRPRLRADVEAIADGPQRLLFVGEQRTFFVDGPLIQALVPLLDGTHDVVALCRALQQVGSSQAVLGELMRLESLGALVAGPAPSNLSTTAFFDAVGVEQHAARVSLIGVAAESMAPLLRSGGLSVDVAGSLDCIGDGVVVAVVADYLDPLLAQVNAWALENRRVWMLCRPSGMKPWVGPMIVPGITGCWSCLVHRLGINRQLDAYLRMSQARQEPSGVPIASTPATVGVVAGLLAAAVCQAVADPGSSPLAGQLITVDLVGMAMVEHMVTRRPQCPACGDPVGEATPKQVVIGQQPKWTDPESGARSHRTRDAASTMAALERHISPLTGVVTSVVPVETGTPLFSAYSAGHPFTISRTRFDVLARTLRGSVSGGKGRTPDQARIGAVCEAIERGSGLFRGDETQITSSYNELGEAAQDPGVLFQFSDFQYDQADERNATTESRYEFIPRRFDPAARLQWTEAWSPVDGRRTLLPSSYCFYGHPDMYNHWFYVCDSNGNASGNCIEEAIAYGFYELIERDSVALWWYNRLRRPALDLGTCGDPYLDDVRAYYEKAGRDLWVVDLTTDSEVPVFAAMSRRVDHPVEDLLVGFGCHLDPRVALDRAIDELNQFMPMVAGRNLDGSTRYWGVEPEAQRWCERATLATQPYFAPDAGQPAHHIADMINRCSDDAGDDVRVCAERARALGLDLYAVDLSRPEVDLAVAKVVVPGLRHFWRRLGPGRLYDTPVTLGWLDQANHESDLNPETVYF